jgi:GNAT superfamily N-acetyltransferase
VVLGFQALGFYPVLPGGWLDIGTFVNAQARGTGAGAALFEATKAVARARGCQVINASIRADNALGLGFYTRLGFVDYDFDPDFALKNGQRVGRVSKRYDLV